MASHALTDIPSRPTLFVVGAHTLALAKSAGNGRWTLTLDGALLEGTFEKQVDAWEAGVRAADRIDRERAQAR